MSLVLDYLNHASVLLRVGPHAILSDPWYEGTAFSGGWGLRYHNQAALQTAAQASHLWISHWHSDHLHAPTLERLARLNPEMVVLANVSANFSMVERLRGLGFSRVLPLPEREPLALGARVEVTRYPTAGIDNMLHLRAPGWSVLNYNDCNLPATSLAMLRRTLGPIDLLLNNYNHAGKLFRRDTAENEKAALWRTFARVAEVLGARWVVPFASDHYYRSELSRDQNASLLRTDDLRARAAHNPRLLLLEVGQRASFGSSDDPAQVVPANPPAELATEELHDYGPSRSAEQLLGAADARCEQLRRAFLGLSRLLDPLRVAVSDLRSVLVLDPAGRASLELGSHAHIEAHSRAIHDWLARRFGDDTFFAGAHFALRDPDTSVIERWALATMLEASHLDPHAMLGYLRAPAGLRFLWSRREELAGTLVGARFRAGQIRL